MYGIWRVGGEMSKGYWECKAFTGETLSYRKLGAAQKEVERLTDICRKEGDKATKYEARHFNEES